MGRVIGRGRGWGGMIFGEDGTDGHLGSGRGWEDLDDGVSDVGKEGKRGTRLWGFGLGDAG